MDPVIVITCPSHVTYGPSVEVQCGTRISAYDSRARIDSIAESLDQLSWVSMRSPSDFGMDPILRVHDQRLLVAIERIEAVLGEANDPSGQFFADTFVHRNLPEVKRALIDSTTAPAALMGIYCFDTMTSVTVGTTSSILGAVNTALSGAKALAGGVDLVVSLCRPPGHHTSRNLFGGGTYLNNISIAAQWLLDNDIQNLAILDIDFHHGNGTQSIFYDRSDVMYVSIHGHPNRVFPYYAGSQDELGSGPGYGSNHNLPLPPSIEGAQYLSVLDQAISIIDDRRPEALLISLGFDTYVDDLAGDARLVTQDYASIGASVRSIGLPVLAVLEGGYHVASLGTNVRTWLQGASGLDPNKR
jgi:acetoin utilization deacetylase AcuC-like enzyme